MKWIIQKRKFFQNLMLIKSTFSARVSFVKHSTQAGNFRYFNYANGLVQHATKRYPKILLRSTQERPGVDVRFLFYTNLPPQQFNRLLKHAEATNQRFDLYEVFKKLAAAVQSYAATSSLLQFFFKEINGPFPGQFCGGFVVTGCGIVMKSVVGIGIHVRCIFFAIFF